MIQADERWSHGSVKASIGVKEEIPKRITWKMEPTVSETVLRDSWTYPGVFRPKDIQYGEYPKNMLEDSLTNQGWDKNWSWDRLKLVTL